MTDHMATQQHPPPPALRATHRGRALERGEGLALAGSVALFLALALYRLGSFSLWLDEIMALDFSDGSLRELFGALRGDVHAPVYYLGLLGFIRVFGISEWTARLPGVLLGALTLLFLYPLARQAAGRRTTFYAVLLLACSPFFIEFSREARPYVASACLAVASWFFFLRLLRRGRRADAAGYALSSALLLLTFYPGVVAPAAQGLMLLACRAAGRKWRLILSAWLAAALIFLAAWGGALWAQLHASGESGRFWLDAYYPGGIAARDVLAALGDLFCGTASGSLAPALRGGLVAVLVLGSFGVLFAPGSKRLPRARGLAVPLAVWPLWGSLAVFILICLVKPLLVSRYLTLLAPFAALLIALALGRLPARVGRGLLALFLAAGLAGYAGYLRAMPRSDWRGAAQILQSRMKPLDVIVTENTTARSCLGYYFKLLRRPQLAGNVCSFDDFMRGTGGGRYAFPDRTLWVVASQPARQARQLAVLNAQNRLESKTPLAAGFQLLRFSSRAAALALRQ